MHFPHSLHTRSTNTLRALHKHTRPARTQGCCHFNAKSDQPGRAALPFFYSNGECLEHSTSNANLKPWLPLWETCKGLCKTNQTTASEFYIILRGISTSSLTSLLFNGFQEFIFFLKTPSSLCWITDLWHMMWSTSFSKWRKYIILQLITRKESAWGLSYLLVYVKLLTNRAFLVAQW